MRGIIRTAVMCMALVACAPEEDLTQPPVAIGQFRLGHNIAIADKVTEGPFSREFTETQIEASVQNAVAARLRRYDGDGLYHLGIVVGGLVLGQPGIPVVYAPKSVLIADVTVFDNATQKKLNDKPKRFYAGEGLKNAVPVIGSGYVRTGEEQLENLSESLAREIEDWLRENEAWFAPVPGQVRVPYDAATYAPRIDSLSTQDIGASAPAN
ncbi:hypothetical protein EF888_00495 [Silicimonas algicola]|nr:hypothetical protein [Silicimonas algicola]AZQ65741.1 hypothetical protein EF888_00495 [Silicimonas algicola]